MELKASSFENELKIYRKGKTPTASLPPRNSKDPNNENLIKILRGFIFNDQVSKLVEELEVVLKNMEMPKELQEKLSKLQLQEKKRYDSIEIFEKENYEVKFFFKNKFSHKN